LIILPLAFFLVILYHGYHCRTYIRRYFAFEGAEKIYEYIIPHEQVTTIESKIPKEEVLTLEKEK
jgi:hypothetical protein